MFRVYFLDVEELISDNRGQVGGRSWLVLRRKICIWFFILRFPNVRPQPWNQVFRAEGEKGRKVAHLESLALGAEKGRGTGREGGCTCLVPQGAPRPELHLPVLA